MEGPAVSKPSSPSLYLREESADVATQFKGMRAAIKTAGPLDARVLELVILGSLATAGLEEAFKGHAARAIGEGLKREEIRHAVMATLGSSLPMMSVVTALRWIDDI